MNTTNSACSTPRSVLGIFILAAVLLLAPPVRAGLSLNVHLYHDNNAYFAFPLLSTNLVTASDPTDTYFVSSPLGLIHGELDAGSTFSQAGSPYFDTLDDLFQELTNGNWTLLITNGVSTNQYLFTISVTGVTSNEFAPVTVIFPTNGAVQVTNTPTFAWQGPTNWGGTLMVYENFTDTNGDNYSEDSVSLPPDQTNWTCPGVLPNGTNQFSPNYQSNVTALIVANIPTNSLLQPLAGWVSTATLETYCNSQFLVGPPPVSPSATNPVSGGHVLVAHYTFDDSGYLGQDSSTNGNDLDCSSSWGSGSGQTFSTEAIAGGGAVQFFGYSSLTPCHQSFTNWTNTLAGSFSVSLWLNTTTRVGNDTDMLDDSTGQSVIYADSYGHGTTPVGVTGGKAAFFTGDPDGNQDTLHSTNDVTTGQYVHIVVTRNQASGAKIIYINGALDSSDYSSTEALVGDTYASIGGEHFSAFNGLVDDVQIYSGVLSPAEVTNLFSNPGATAPDVAGTPANGLIAHYDFAEGTVVAPDVSGNGNNIVLAGNFGGNGPVISPDAVAGTASVYFDGGSFLTAPSNLLATLAGSFTVTLWVNTTQYVGNANDYAFNGAGLVSADLPGLANDLIPVALTGGQVAFNTGNALANSDDTLNSSAAVNDGSWHQVAVSRNQATGEKDIYIDGVLDTSDFDTTALLDDPQLLTLGAIADASNPDPTSPASTGYNGYQGLLDDLQIYNRPLSPAEVAYLYANPGATLAVAVSTPYPVDVSLQLGIVRSQDPNLGEYFSASVNFNSVNPAPTTTNRVASPNNFYGAEQDAAGGGSSYNTISGSLAEVLNECTNGFWKLSINQGSPTQQNYSFQVAITGLDTNLLQAVTVFSPTNHTVTVATNPAYFWAGPTNFSTLQVDLLSGPVAYPPVTATNWPDAPAAGYGPNFLGVDYNSNNFPGITFTTPVDVSTNPVRTWTTSVTLSTEAFADFVVGPPPVQLVGAQSVGANVQFSYLSLVGVSNSIQYCTNLVQGNWLTCSNLTGDGTLKTILVPSALFNGSPQGFIRVSSD